MTHFQHLERLAPGLAGSRILDIGSGEGAFAIEAARAGCAVTAIEYYPVHIQIAEQRAKEQAAIVTFQQGVAEALPFPDASFDFINMSEVLEHVEDPGRALKELYRVLRPGGHAYLSAPNRLGMRDPHFRLYFINWMPRSWAEATISLLGKHKDAVESLKGRNELSRMHYYRYDTLAALVRTHGFVLEDIRIRRMKELAGPMEYPFARIAYGLLRTFYYDTFHLLLFRSE